MYANAAIDVFTKLFAIYNLFLILAAIVLNPVVLFICTRSKKLRSTSTFKILAFCAINDIFNCIPWNLESFTNTFFNLNLPFLSIFYCQWISVFFQFASSQLESWLLVSISLDRLLSLTFKNWSKIYFMGYRPIIYSIALSFIIACININEVFTIGFIDIVNETTVVICYESRANEIDLYEIMSQVYLYVGFIIPYFVLVLSNLLIIYKATRFERSHRNEISSIRHRKMQMTKTIILMTSLFILTSLPSTIVTGYFYTNIVYQETGQMIVNLVNGIQYSYPAFHFFILYFTNKLFAEEVKNLWPTITKKPNSSTNINTINACV